MYNDLRFYLHSVNFGGAGGGRWGICDWYVICNMNKKFLIKIKYI